MHARLVYRNQTNREDAVYIITASTTNGVHTVAGEWGKWDTFRKGGKLQRKVYFTGVDKAQVSAVVYQMITRRNERGYQYLAQFSQMDDEVMLGRWATRPEPTPPAAPPTRATTPAPPPPTPQPGESPTPYAGIETRAGALEF